jgi:predicted permease
LLQLLDNVLNVMQLVLQLFLLMGIGVVCGKCKWVDDVGAKQMTNLLLKVVTFCVIVESFLSVEYSIQKLKYLLVGAGACVVCTFVGLLVLMPFFKNKEATKQSVLRFGVIFSNCGFMSLPLVSALLGSQGVFVVSIYVAVFQCFCWTLGVKIYGRFDVKNLKKIIFNPGVISVLVGLPLFLLKVKCPTVLLSPLGMLADLNTPVAMVVTGYYLSKMTLKIQKGDGAVFLAASLRLIVIPLLTFGVLYLLGLRGFLLVTCMVPICAPSASNTSLFAVMFGGDEVYASRLVSICTLLSILTMPLIIALAQTTV